MMSSGPLAQALTKLAKLSTSRWAINAVAVGSFDSPRARNEGPIFSRCSTIEDHTLGVSNSDARRGSELLPCDSIDDVEKQSHSRDAPHVRDHVDGDHVVCKPVFFDVR